MTTVLPVLILITCAGGLITGEAAAALAAKPFAHQTSDLAVDPAVTWGRLANGVRWATMTNQQPRDKVSIRVQVQSGSLQETDEQRGLAHYLEHLAFNGTTHYPAGSVITVLQAMGIGFGQHSNAHTSFDETVYKLDLPDAKPETLETGMQVVADWVGGMLLADAEIEKERGIILAEMRDRNSPGFRQYVAGYSAQYPGLIIGQRFAIGVESTVKGVTPALIRDFYRRWYRPERLVVAVVGALTSEVASAAIAKHFAPLQPLAPAAESTIGTLVGEALRVSCHHEAEADGTDLALTLVRAGKRPADNAVFRRHELLRSLATSVLSRRLHEIAEKATDGPLLGGAAYTYWWLDHEHAVVHAQLRPGRVDDAVRLIDQELRRFLQHGPTAAELAAAVANARAQLDAAVAQKTNRPNTAIAQALYSHIEDDAVFQSPEQTRELVAPWLPAITGAEVRTAAVAAWAVKPGSHRCLFVSGRDAAGAEVEARLRATVTASEQVAVAAPVESAAKPWAYARKPPAPAPAAERTAAHDIVELRFPNQARANLKRTAFKPGEVLVQVRIELPTAAHAPGLRELASRAMLSGGLKAHSVQELRDVLAASTARVGGPGFDEDGLTFSGTCLPGELELCLQQARAWLTEPGWRAEAEVQAKAGWMEELKALDANLNAQVMRRFSELAGGGEPHRRAATAAEAAAVTFAQVRAWIEPYLLSAPLTVSICGDIDVAAAKDLAAAYIGSLPDRQALRVIPDLAAPGALAAGPTFAPGEHRFTVAGTVPRALLVVAWRTDDFRDPRRTRRLGLLADVFSDRLREKLREELGAAYSPHAAHRASQAYQGHGQLSVNAAVAPDLADKSLAVIKALGKELSEQGITDAQLIQSKAPLTRNLTAQRQQNGYWLNTVMARSQQHPQRLEWAATMEADYAAISAAELSELAKRYLAGETLVVVGVCSGK